MGNYASCFLDFYVTLLLSWAILSVLDGFWTNTWVRRLVGMIGKHGGKVRILDWLGLACKIYPAFVFEALRILLPYSFRDIRTRSTIVLLHSVFMAFLKRCLQGHIQANNIKQLSWTEASDGICIAR